MLCLLINASDLSIGLNNRTIDQFNIENFSLDHNPIISIYYRRQLNIVHTNRDGNLIRYSYAIATINDLLG